MVVDEALITANTGKIVFVFRDNILRWLGGFARWELPATLLFAAVCRIDCSYDFRTVLGIRYPGSTMLLSRFNGYTEQSGTPETDTCPWILGDRPGVHPCHYQKFSKLRCSLRKHMRTAAG